jgi:hypothetical protein
MTWLQSGLPCCTVEVNPKGALMMKHPLVREEKKKQPHSDFNVEFKRLGVNK